MATVAPSKRKTRPKRQPPSRSTGVTFGDVRELALKLPATEEGTCYGTPAIRVKGKFLLRLKEDAETVVIKTPFDYRQALLQADPRVFYFAGMNEEWARWFPAEPPARQGAALLLVREGMRLSVAVIALEGDSAPWRHGA